MNKMPFILLLLVMLVGNSCDNEPYDGPLALEEISTIDDDPITSEEDDPTDSEEFQNTMYGLLDGTQLLFDDISVGVSNGFNNNFIQIQGVFSNHYVNIVMPSNLTSGVYYYSQETIDTFPDLYVIYSDFTNPSYSSIGNGSMTILEHNITIQRIKGIFQCAIVTQEGMVLNLTQGSFEVSY